MFVYVKYGTKSYFCLCFKANPEKIALWELPWSRDLLAFREDPKDPIKFRRIVVTERLYNEGDKSHVNNLLG